MQNGVPSGAEGLNVQTGLSVAPASDTHKRLNKKHDGLICQQCGNSFSGRVDARYCSGVCRKGAHRRVEQIQDMALTAIGAIRDIKRLSAKYADDARLSAALAIALEDIRTALSVSVAAKTEKPVCPKCGGQKVVYDRDLMLNYCFDCSEHV